MKAVRKSGDIEQFEAVFDVKTSDFSAKASQLYFLGTFDLQPNSFSLTTGVVTNFFSLFDNLTPQQRCNH